MHVVWINEAASFLGGAETYVARSVSLMAKRGWSSTLLYDPNKRSDPSYLNLFDAAFPLVDLESQLLELQPDAVYLHQYWDAAAIAFLADSGISIVRFYHDHHLFCLRKHKLTTLRKQPCSRPVGFHCYPCLGFVNREEGKVRFRTLETIRAGQAIERRFSAHVVGSEYMKQHLVAHGYDEEKVSVIPPFSSLPEVADQDKKGFVVVGQLLPGKGVDLAIRATALVDGATLTIVGEGSGEASLRALVEELGCGERVRFVGRKEGGELSSTLASSLALLFPVRAPETFGMVGIEAFQQRTTVIAPSLGGIAEWLRPGETGLVVPPNDVESLVSAMNQLQSDPAFARQLGMRGSALVRERFDERRHVEAMERCFSMLSSRYTPFGGVEVECSLRDITRAAAVLVRRHLTRDEYTSLLLIGGYGKGEGGVEKTEEGEKPHNNLDLLLVTPHKSCPALDADLEQLSHASGIGIDLSYVSAQKLRRSPQLLMWHDMMEGHKTLLGDQEFIRTLPFGDVTKTLPFELTKLMANRGTLLLINDWLLAHTPDTESRRRTLIKHLVKAIIGYGDALLFFLGDYHWSYLEKQRRMKERQDIPESFRKEYDRAVAFRLQPNYATALPDPIQWNEALRNTFGEIYLRCERLRLGDSSLNWDDYLDKAIEHQLAQTSWVRQGVHIFRNHFSLFSSRLSPSDELTLSFPYLCFHKEHPKQTRTLDQYLTLWGKEADSNFFKVLQTVETKERNDLSHR